MARYCRRSTPPFPSCAYAGQQCFSSPDCTQCINELQNYTYALTTNMYFGRFQQRQKQTGFWASLNHPACLGIAAQRPNLVAAVLTLALPDPILSSGCPKESSTTVVSGVVQQCQLDEWDCFINETCRDCLSLVQASADSPTQRGSVPLTLPICQLAIHGGFPLFYGWGGLASTCAAFPSCTQTVDQCENAQHSVVCDSCLTTLRQGLVSQAVQDCPTPNGTVDSTTDVLDLTVQRCTFAVDVGCDYFAERCRSLPQCGRCLSAMKNGSDVVGGLSDPACRYIYDLKMSRNGQLLENYTDYEVWYLTEYIQTCPDAVTTVCATQKFLCATYSSEDCWSCLTNDTYAVANAARCEARFRDFDISEVCAQCPRIVQTINTIVFATQVVGGVSALSCILVILTIVAYSKDMYSPRVRHRWPSIQSCSC